MERRIVKVLDKFGIEAADLAAPEGQLEAQLVKDEMPEDAAAAIAGLRRAMEEQYGRLADAASDLDPTLEKPVRSEGHNSIRRLGEIEKRLVGQLKRQNAMVGEQLAKARANLYPLGRPQERVLNALPYLVRYGDALVDGVLEKCSAWMAALDTAHGDT
jgi:uncharacterized protein YllA (UPF0747 family)